MTTPPVPISETRSAPRNELAPGDVHQEAGDRRIAAAAEPHDQVVDLARAARRRRRAADCRRPRRGAGSAAPARRARSLRSSYARGRSPTPIRPRRATAARAGPENYVGWWCCRSGYRSRCCRSCRERSWRSRARFGGGPARFRSRRWAVMPPLSVIAFVFGARAAEHASAQGLTYLALCAVPLLAALALGWLLWDARQRARGVRRERCSSCRCSRSRGPTAAGWRGRPRRWPCRRSAASRWACCSRP